MAYTPDLDFSISAATLDVSSKMTQKVAKLHRLKKYENNALKSLQEDYCYKVDDMVRGPMYFAKNIYHELLTFIEAL
jgi:hypothetical protein